jgi:hypothetical protein
LRRFLDDQVWLENRRVMDLLRGIESSALRLRDESTGSFVMEIDAAAPSVSLPMERPMYRTRSRETLNSSAVTAGDEVVDVSVLFEQVHVDPLRLSAGVRDALRRRAQIGLAEIVEDQPLEQGLAELVTYLSLTDPAFHVVFDEEQREQVQWTDADGLRRTATMPRVTFTRAGTNTVES